MPLFERHETRPTVVTFRVTTGEAETMDEAASMLGLPSRSEVLRRALRHLIASEPALTPLRETTTIKKKTG